MGTEGTLSRHLPYAALELLLPTIETAFRIRSLIEFFVLPLAAHMHLLTRKIIGLAIPAAGITRIIVWRLAIFSFAAFAFSMAISKRALSYTASIPATKRFRKKLEMEIYSFLLGPGNAILKLGFWIGWWWLVWTVIRAPWWYFTS